MKRELTDNIIRSLPAPTTGISIVRDSKIMGLGVRILPSGTRAFILDYVIAGRRRIYTIGKCDDWKLPAVREHAKNLKHDIRVNGFDPAAELKAAREAPTVEDLCKQFTAEHLPKLRPSTQGDYRRMIDKDILPELGKRKVASIEYTDIKGLHHALTKRAPISANFCLSLLSKLFNVAIREKMIDHNPAKGIERNPSLPRSRYLDKAEIASLFKALAAYSDQDMADIFRLLLFTGARRGETQSATWDQFNLDEGLWVKPSAATKQKREHRVPLSKQAIDLLLKRRALANASLAEIAEELADARPADRRELEERKRRTETYLFPARTGATGHITEIKGAWDVICATAGIVSAEQVIDEKGQTHTVMRRTVRIHDLRHTAASVLVSAGASLPLVGQLLGHTQVATTQRYAHLFDDAQRKAVNKMGAAIEGKPRAKVIAFKKRSA